MSKILHHPFNVPNQNFLPSTSLGGGEGRGGITGPNLELLCTWQSDAAPFWENYAKLYFDAKH